MDLKLKTWYLAEHIFGDIPYYNYFLEIDNNVKFISIDAKKYQTQLIKITYDDFENNILYDFEFSEGNINNTIKKEVLKGLLK